MSVKSTQSLPAPSSLCIAGNHSLFTVCRERGAFSLPESDRVWTVKETQRDTSPPRDKFRPLSPPSASSLSLIGAPIFIFFFYHTERLAAVESGFRAGQVNNTLCLRNHAPRRLASCNDGTDTPHHRNLRSWRRIQIKGS